MKDTKAKRGRKPIESTGAMTSAQRATRARAKDLGALNSGDLTDTSISGLISLLPKLFADGEKEKIAMVLKELLNRV